MMFHFHPGKNKKNVTTDKIINEITYVKMLHLKNGLSDSMNLQMLKYPENFLMTNFVDTHIMRIAI